MDRREPRRFAYRTPPELRGAPGRQRPVVIVGAGPVGLTAAIDLALAGVPVVVLDDNDRVSTGSRAICWAKRTLEIWDRLGVADRMVEKGVTWKVGRVFHGDRELYAFDLLPEAGHKMPAFINLQQYYVEEYLIDRAAELGDAIDLRWKNRVRGVHAGDGGVRLDVGTPDGDYPLDAAWIVAADGARSPMRGLLGLDLVGHSFEERFLIADVRLEAELPSERWFWFEPTFHAGQSALLHRQPDRVYRIDFQLGADADPDLERRAERVMPRVRAAIGDGTACELEWCSVYSFRCARLERFVHGRIVFAGDSAHVVSPFGARGGNGGVQDADNLAWKLAAVLAGRAPDTLIETYDEERGRAADENIINSSRTTRFMTPKSAAERRCRDAVLDLAHGVPFARALVNGGRLSRPATLDGLSLQTDDPGDVEGAMRPGAPALDAPLFDGEGRATWLLQHLGGEFRLLQFVNEARIPASGGIPSVVVAQGTGAGAEGGALVDHEGYARRRFGGEAGVTYLVRPDQHIAARFAHHDPAAIAAALARACGQARR